MTAQLSQGAQSQVVELASNDGYLLQYVERGVPCLGVEPAANVAATACRARRCRSSTNPQPRSAAPRPRGDATGPPLDVDQLSLKHPTPTPACCGVKERQP